MTLWIPCVANECLAHQSCPSVSLVFIMFISEQNLRIWKEYPLRNYTMHTNYETKCECAGCSSPDATNPWKHCSRDPRAQGITSCREKWPGLSRRCRTSSRHHGLHATGQVFKVCPCHISFILLMAKFFVNEWYWIWYSPPEVESRFTHKLKVGDTFSLAWMNACSSR